MKDYQKTSRSRRIVVPLLALLIGLAVGLSSIFWYGLSAEKPIGIAPSSAQGNLVVEANKEFITQLVQKQLANSGLPGQIENVQVDLNQGGTLTINGDDVYSILGVNLFRHFTIDTQIYIQACAMQIHVTQANMGGIPMTGIAHFFESTINQRLAKKNDNLPSGFAYCVVGVRTEPGGLFITSQATPLEQ